MFNGLLLSIALTALAPTPPTDSRLDNGMKIVLTRLKDPDSARFSEVEVVQHGSEWAVCGTVRAKNGLGGYNEPDFFIAVGQEAFLRSENHSLRQFQVFDEVYQEACGRSIVH